MEENNESNTKSAFFDEAISNNLKKEKVEHEVKNNKNEQSKKEIKTNDININNELESAMIINYKKKKSINIDGMYCSLKLPKFIDVNSDIKKKKRKKVKVEKERKTDEEEAKKVEAEEVEKYEQISEEDESEMEYFKKRKTSIISWSFDEQLYNKINFEKNIKNRESSDNFFFNENNYIKNNNKENIENSINITKNIISVNDETENSKKSENENKIFNNADEKDVEKTNEVKNKEENLNSFSSKLDKLYTIKSEYSTDEESKFNDSKSDLTNLEDLYEKYEIENSDIMSVSSNESNENMKILCNNLKYLETNSFVVEYEDEEDNETNCLIESTEENFKPIHRKLEKKFFIKSIAAEEQTITNRLKLKEEDIYYSLDKIKVSEEVEN